MLNNMFVVINVEFGSSSVLVYERKILKIFSLGKFKKKWRDFMVVYFIFKINDRFVIVGVN
jgi:hypothetical protein